MSEPATKADLDALEGRMNERMGALEDRLIRRMDEMQKATEDRLIEHMRDMQTEILRGMGTLAEGLGNRMYKIEHNHQVLDASTTQRLATVENRLWEIEKRLMMNPPEQKSN